MTTMEPTMEEIRKVQTRVELERDTLPGEVVLAGNDADGKCRLVVEMSANDLKTFKPNLVYRAVRIMRRERWEEVNAVRAATEAERLTSRLLNLSYAIGDVLDEAGKWGAVPEGLRRALERLKAYRP